MTTNLFVEFNQQMNRAPAQLPITSLDVRHVNRD